MTLTERTIVVDPPPLGGSLTGLDRSTGEGRNSGGGKKDKQSGLETGPSKNGQHKISTTISIGERDPIIVICEEFELDMVEAMRCLLKGHRYATELRVDVWDFAVEIDFLRQRGISDNDLRWLVGSGWLDQAKENTATGNDRRIFSRGGHLSFDARTCFVLTENGVLVAQALCERFHCDANASTTHSGTEELVRQVTHVKPQWFEDRQQLYLGDNLVKEFKLPSPNQIAILSVFEEEQWPPHIDDPLPMCQTVGPKERLRYTIKSLNKHQKKSRIRFRGDGRGEGVCWELWGQDTDSATVHGISGSTRLYRR